MTGYSYLEIHAVNNFMNIPPLYYDDDRPPDLTSTHSTQSQTIVDNSKVSIYIQRYT